MALDPLATADDLAAYGITYDPSTEQTKVDRFLASASAAVRESAEVPISQATSIIGVTAIPGADDEYLPLPGPPVTAVASVLDESSTTVTGWKLVRDALWRRCGWVHHREPTTWTVTMTHGLVVVPEDIITYVCVLVAGALSASRESDDGTGLAPDLSVSTVRIDDFGEGYVAPADRLATPFAIPEHVRLQLRARFGGGSAIVSSR